MMINKGYLGNIEKDMLKITLFDRSKTKREYLLCITCEVVYTNKHQVLIALMFMSFSPPLIFVHLLFYHVS